MAESGDAARCPPPEPRPAAPSPARWIALWLLLTLLGGIVWTLRDIDRQQADFETQARIAHRLLSQRAVEHEAILRTLSLTQAPASALLSSVYSRVLAVHQRLAGSDWPDAMLRDAEAAAVAAHQPNPVLAHADLGDGRFTLLIAARGSAQAAYALDINAPLMVDPADWPFAADSGRDTVALRHGGTQRVLQAAPAVPALRRFAFAKRLAADSQPFELAAERTLAWTDLPWAGLALWAVLAAALTGTARLAWQQRQVARRSAELLRLGQVARINALGEFAAGLAHEFNQPLAALVANAQAARRLLDDDPPDPVRARAALVAAGEQGQRAAAVVARLRQRIEARDAAAASGPFDLAGLIRRAAALIEPDCRREGIALSVAVPDRLAA